MHDRGHHPSIITYNILLDGLCKSQLLDEAIKLFKRIVDQGIPPNVYVYTTLIDGLIKGGRLNTAADIFQHLLAEGYPLDVKAYNAMINGFCKEGLFYEAEGLLRKMEKNGCLPDSGTYEIIIRGVIDRNYNDKAEKLLHEMIDRGMLKRNGEKDGATAEEQKWEYIWPVLMMLESGNADAYMHTTLIDGLIKGGKLNIAVDIFQYLLVKGLPLDVKAYTAMINGLCKEGLFYEAKGLLREMEKNGCLPNSVTYEVIVRSVLEGEDNNKALAEKFLHEMIDRGLLKK